MGIPLRWIACCWMMLMFKISSHIISSYDMFVDKGKNINIRRYDKGKNIFFLTLWTCNSLFFLQSKDKKVFYSFLESHQHKACIWRPGGDKKVSSLMTPKTVILRLCHSRLDPPRHKGGGGTPATGIFPGFCIPREERMECLAERNHMSIVSEQHCATR